MKFKDIDHRTFFKKQEASIECPDITGKDILAMSVAVFQLLFPFLLIVTGAMGLFTWFMF